MTVTVFNQIAGNPDQIVVLSDRIISRPCRIVAHPGQIVSHSVYNDSQTGYIVCNQIGAASWHIIKTGCPAAELATQTVPDTDFAKNLIGRRLHAKYTNDAENSKFKYSALSAPLRLRVRLFKCGNASAQKCLSPESPSVPKRGI